METLDFFQVHPIHREELEKAYQEPHRFYHNTDHILDILNLIEENCEDPMNKHMLVAAAIYHDAVYDIKSKTNEEDSAVLFAEHTKHVPANGKWIAEVIKIIQATSDHNATTALGQTFCEFDLNGLTHGNLKRVLTDEWKIMLEYQRFDYSEYRKGRIDFLENFLLKKGQNKDVIEAQIECIKNRVLNIGVYAGSFNPFHKGHLNILEKAEQMFDKVIIAKGVNPGKANKTWSEWDFLTKYRQVDTYSVDLPTYLRSKAQHAKITLIRGLRNGADWDYEKNQLRILTDIDPQINAIFIPCDREFEHISSSAIREMSFFSDELFRKAEPYYKP